MFTQDDTNRQAMTVMDALDIAATGRHLDAMALIHQRALTVREPGDELFGYLDNLIAIVGMWLEEMPLDEAKHTLTSIRANIMIEAAHLDGGDND